MLNDDFHHFRIRDQNTKVARVLSNTQKNLTGVQLLPSKGHRQRNKSQKEDRQYNQREMDPYITDTSMKEASSDSISSSSK